MPVRIIGDHHHVFQRVAGFPRPVRARIEFVRLVHQRFNRGGVRGRPYFRGGGVVIREGLRSDGGDGLRVGGVASGRLHECVLTDCAGEQEFFGVGTAHRATQSVTNDVIQPETGKDPPVSPAVQGVRMLQPLIREVKGIGVFHHELATPNDPRPRTSLVTVLFLHLVQNDRQVFVRGVQVFYRQGKHFFVGGGQQVIPVFAIFELEQRRAELFPTVRRHVRFAGQQHRELQFLSPDTVHLFTHNVFHAPQSFQPQR